VKPLILDASVVAKWFLDEEFAEPARRLLFYKDLLFAPDFLVLELDNVFWKRVRRKDLSREDADAARAELRDLPLLYAPFHVLRDSAFELANQVARSVYDCLYLALAIALDGRVATADRKFYSAVSLTPFAKYLVWVEDLQPVLP